MAEIVIMDFSGIYKGEQFFEGEKVSWLDVREIPGTNCYCDDEAKTQILEKLEEFSAGGIYFIDSGNYHYMSRIGIERVKEPFRLLEGFSLAAAGSQVQLKRQKIWLKYGL